MITPNAKPVTLESLQAKILDKQAEMEQLLDQGALEEANAASKEIDALQSGYQAMKAAGIKPANEAETPKAAAPAPTLPEIVIKKIGRPYDLENQHKFIIQLFAALPDPRNADQVELVHMYQAIANTIELATWVADATKDRLLRLPSNQPPVEQPEDNTAKTKGDLEIYIDKDIDGSFLAYFSDWCEVGAEISGQGNTPEEAVSKLFKEREKLKQQILFPEGGAHE